MAKKLHWVRGWRKGTNGREPMPIMTILAEDGLQAARSYAKVHRIHTGEWFGAGPTPPIVIRVSEELDKEP